MFKRTKISTGVLIALGGVLAAPANAQTQQTPQRIEVTGSRIVKQDLLSSSPILTISGEELRATQAITIEEVLNALPQVNPAGTLTSNNPGNGGQANIDLRGLGANRNLVLIDGRRPMVSASDQTVDVNAIPLSMVESIEVISGGAGAVYGADAVSGVVNIKLKKNFQGVDLRAGWSNTTKDRDFKETSFQGVAGANFADNRGNVTVGFELAKRQKLIKGQRDFAKVATSTTTGWPEGRYAPSGNAPTQAAVDALYAGYGYTGPQIPNTSAHSFNSDGTLFYPGLFNSPLDVANFRYPIDDGVNTKFYPDFYSYNFDAVNLLVLPLDRLSLNGKLNFKLDNNIEVFGQASFTNYDAATALAPTPTGGIRIRPPGEATSIQVQSPLVEPNNFTTGLIVPLTNPFIPADLRTLLATRTGDNAKLVGSGATEPLLLSGWRTVPVGLRLQDFDNKVEQVLAGVRGPLGKSWSWEAYASRGRTVIATTQTGNINGNRLAEALAAPDGGQSLCAGGVNPFGRQPLSAECVQYLNVATNQSITFDQRIAQAFVSGDVAEMPAGPVSAVVGAETRQFSYALDPGAASGPIYGFNTQSPAGGDNSFRDVFGELSIPLVQNAPFARSANLSLAARTSQSQSEDTVNGVKSEKQRSNTFALNMDWSPNNAMRARLSLQRAVRAPNFGELFDGGGSFPQIFDPCSVNSVGRTTGPDAAQLGTLCGSTASPVNGNTTFVASPGAQAFLGTTGNTALKPETGDSVTLGLVFQPRNSGWRGSVDYFRVKVRDAILVPDPNEVIADCYNYSGRNPTYDAANTSCDSVFRTGDNITSLDAPGTSDGYFTGSNGGYLERSGVDVAVAWGGALGPGKVDVELVWNHLLKAKQRSADFLPTYDYTGTIPFFGAGLGQAFPENKAVLTTKYGFGPFSGTLRARYIGAMTNRMSKIFPGERFTGVPATTYFDVGAGWEFRPGFTLRAGINNVADQKPRTYAPNVQSGTDPSTYDVVGRRLFLQANVVLK
jgi:outer membrane receptor protein involved in Fe transport